MLFPDCTGAIGFKIRKDVHKHRVVASMTSDPVHPQMAKRFNDVIIISLGVRYNFHCANMARTFFVDPVDVVT